jgi:hypothetical protein
MFVLAWVTAWRVRLPGRITALEVRRLISEAQEHGAPFVLRYTRLPSEAHSLPGSFVTYRYNGPGKASRCRARQPGALLARPCAANELPRLPPPGPPPPNSYSTLPIPSWTTKARIHTVWAEPAVEYMNAFTHARDGQRPSAGEDFVSHVSFLLVVMVLCVVCAQVLFQLPCTVYSENT